MTALSLYKYNEHSVAEKKKALNAGETTAFNICIWIQLPIFIKDLLDIFHLNSPLQDFFPLRL